MAMTTNVRRHFLTASTLLLSAARKLVQSGVLPLIQDQAWDTSGVLDERSGVGQVVAAMTGPLITFLSDYGLEDEFAGVCHAVIAGICPEARVIDLTHGIPRHDVSDEANVATVASIRAASFHIGTTRLHRLGWVTAPLATTRRSGRGRRATTRAVPSPDGREPG